MAEDTPQGITIRLVWDGIENVPIVLANQVVGQVGQQAEIILTFGQVAPPILAGELEQQREQAKEIPFLSVKPVARLALTRAGLDDVIRILNKTRDNWDKTLELPVPPAEEGDEQ